MKTLYTAILCMLLSALANAHTGLKSSFPHQDSVLEQSPESIQLNFNGKVRLIKLSLQNKQDRAIDIGFNAAKQATQRFELPLSTSLSDGNYSIKWIAISGDGHKVKGTIPFRVNDKHTTTAK